jgi:hypothetical protein
VKFKTRLERLEARRREGRGIRVITTTPAVFDLSKSWCIRRRFVKGALSEIINLHGMQEDIEDDDLERWIQSFPIEDVSRI